MLDGFTYKQKNLGLGVLIALFAVLSYQFSISVSLNKAAQLEVAEVKMTKSLSAPQKIKSAKKQLFQLNKEVGYLDNSFNDFQENLLSSIVLYGGDLNVKLISVEEPHSYNRNGFEVQTAIVKLRGSFKNLTQFVNRIEGEDNVGRLASSKFLLVENKRKKRFYLEAELQIQNFKKL